MNTFHVFLLCLSALTGNYLGSDAAGCHPDDESGLLGFKAGITQDPTGLLGSWKKGTDCCKWQGVDCQVGPRVISLSLYGNSDDPKSFLAGRISPSIVKMGNLTGIYFQSLKRLTGGFPDFLSRLPELKYVYIEDSQLSGPIPKDLSGLNRLEALSFEGNRFTGPIPSSVSALTQLTQLKLGGNRLSGVLPLGLAKLKNLTLLSLARNNLSGAIPDFFSSFTDLRVLELSHNKFSGNVPGSIASLAPRLRYLEVGHNDLQGKIPGFLGSFKSLDTLDLSWNRFSGKVPKSFGNLTKIFNLDLSHNNLLDPFPVMNVKGIESLDLSYNHFHLNQIPKWVTTSPIIYSLKLARCGIKIRLDDWKPAETYFYDFIDLSENEISGSPITLLNRTEYLVGFWASGNKLRFDLGKIPFSKRMKYLDLSRNSMFGKVASSVSGLEKLNVSHNHLCGKLPATKFPGSAFAGNDCLCGPPLDPCKAQSSIKKK